MNDAQDKQSLTVREDASEAADLEADAIIKKHMGFAMAGGAIPVPVVDLAAVTAVQLDLLKQLAAHYGVEFEGRSARAFLTSLSAALAGSSVARIGASLVKAVPGIGTIGGGVAQIILTGASTYAVGRLFKRVFREGNDLNALDLTAVREEALEYLEAGKEIAVKLWASLRDRGDGHG